MNILKFTMGNVVATNINVCSTLVFFIVVMISLSSPNIVQPEEIMMHAQNSRIPVDTKLSIIQ